MIKWSIVFKGIYQQHARWKIFACYICTWFHVQISHLRVKQVKPLPSLFVKQVQLPATALRNTERANTEAMLILYLPEVLWCKSVFSSLERAGNWPWWPNSKKEATANISSTLKINCGWNCSLSTTNWFDLQGKINKTYFGITQEPQPTSRS